MACTMSFPYNCDIQIKSEERGPPPPYEYVVACHLMKANGGKCSYIIKNVICDKEESLIVGELFYVAFFANIVCNLTVLCRIYVL